MLMSFVMAENDAKPGSSEPCDAALNDCTLSNVVNVPFVIAPAAQVRGKQCSHKFFSACSLSLSYHRVTPRGRGWDGQG